MTNDNLSSTTISFPVAITRSSAYSCLDRVNDLESCLSELLRLYEWRFELAKKEEEEGKSRAVKKLLNQYGREKLAAWQKARRLLGR